VREAALAMRRSGSLRHERAYAAVEVFIRARNGLAHRHVGSVHAADARLRYRRRGRCIRGVARGCRCGGAVQRHHRLRSRRTRHDVRACGEQIYRHPASTKVPTRGICDGDQLDHGGGDAFGTVGAGAGDDALVLVASAVGMGGACAMLEEDLALSNIALD